MQGRLSGCGALRAGITFPYHAACVSLTLKILPEFEVETKALAAESAGGRPRGEGAGVGKKSEPAS